MKISIVTPALHADADLALAVDSVRAQTYPEVEHIIVAADPTAAPDGSRIIYAPPAGVYDALNRGIAAATGDIIGILHAGDTFATPDVLARVAAAIGRADYIWGDIRYVIGADRIARRRYSGAPGLSVRLLTQGFQPPHPSLFMRRDAALAIGPYDLSEPVCADFDMWVRLAMRPDLHGSYSGILTTLMSLGGLSTQPGSRLWRNNLAKLRILRARSLPASPLRLASRYLYLLRDYATR